MLVIANAGAGPKAIEAMAPHASSDISAKNKAKNFETNDLNSITAINKNNVSTAVTKVNTTAVGVAVFIGVPSMLANTA